MDEETHYKERPAPTNNSKDERCSARERFQFSLRSLFILTTVSALLAALVSTIPLPDIFKIVFLFYVLFMAAYLILRLPFLARGILRKTPAWEKLRQERAELERLVDEKRKKPGEGNKEKR
jgi:hypothetical protein